MGGAECARRESNPYPSRDTDLNRARLPVSPRARVPPIRGLDGLEPKPGLEPGPAAYETAALPGELRRRDRPCRTLIPASVASPRRGQVPGSAGRALPDRGRGAACAQAFIRLSSASSRRPESNRLPPIYKISAQPGELRRLAPHPCALLPVAGDRTAPRRAGSVSSAGVEPALTASSRRRLCQLGYEDMG